MSLNVGDYNKVLYPNKNVCLKVTSLTPDVITTYDLEKDVYTFLTFVNNSWTLNCEVLNFDYVHILKPEERFCNTNLYIYEKLLICEHIDDKDLANLALVNREFFNLLHGKVNSKFGNILFNFFKQRCIKNIPEKILRNKLDNMSWRKCYFRAKKYLKTKHDAIYRNKVMSDFMLFEATCLHIEKPIIIHLYHLQNALFSNQIEFAKWLVRIEPSLIDSVEDSIIQSTIYSGNVETLKWFTSLNPPRIPTLNSIDFLAFNGHHECIEFLYSLPFEQVMRIKLDKDVSYVVLYSYEDHIEEVRKSGKFFLHQKIIDVLIDNIKYVFQPKSREGQKKILEFLKINY